MTFWAGNCAERLKVSTEYWLKATKCFKSNICSKKLHYTQEYCILLAHVPKPRLSSSVHCSQAEGKASAPSDGRIASSPLPLAVSATFHLAPPPFSHIFTSRHIHPQPNTFLFFTRTLAIR